MKRVSYLPKLFRIVTTTCISIGLMTAMTVPAFAAVSSKPQLALSETNGYEDYSIRHQGNCGVDGDNITYTMYDNGLLVLRGNGRMENYAEDQDEKSKLAYMRPWDFGVGGKNWSAEIKAVRIENGITKIGAAAFKDCENLTRVEIPASVTQIGNSAFWGCKNLKSITLPGGLTRIGENAFRSTGLEGIGIPATVQTIEKEAFSWCKLTHVVVPEGVQTIQDSAFSYNDALTAVSLPATMINYGETVFLGCPNLTQISIHPQNPKYTVLANSVYRKDGTELLELDPSASGVYSIPAGTKRIAKSSVTARNLEGVIVPDGVESIASYAFSLCSNLKAVYIPTSVTSMGGNQASFMVKYSNVVPFFIYGGSEAQWSNLNDGLPPTLDNAELFYNGTPDNVAYVVQKYNDALSESTSTASSYDEKGGFYYDPLAAG